MGWLLRRVTRLLKLLLLSPLLLLRRLVGLFVQPDLLRIHLRGEVPDFSSASKLQRLLSKRPPHLSLHEAVTAIDEACRPGLGLKGILIELDQCLLAWIQAEALIAAIERARKAGLKVLVWGDSMTGPALAVAAKGDQTLGSSQGVLGFLGIRVRNLFVRDLLEQVGVLPLIHRHGAYKSMGDMFNRQSMSDAHREMSEELAQDLYAQISAPVVAGRSLSADALRGVIDASPVSHPEAVEAGLLDGEAFRDELKARAGALVGLEDPSKARVLAPAHLLARRRGRQWRRSVWSDPPTLQVIELRGSIVDGETGRGCPATLACEALDAAREDDQVKAVVLRIDSPGGSVTASERIWRAVKRLDGEKPVVASMGRVAASGGYYIAVGARTIVAHPGTLTGSIGVVLGKFNAGPALRRLGVSVDGVQVGARAGLLDPDRGLDPDEDAALVRHLMAYYDAFVGRVAEGRQLSKEAVDAVAQGRVYTGRIARERGLVDRLGGLRLAVDLAKQEAELGDFLSIERVRVKDERGLAATLLGGSALPSALLPGVLGDASEAGQLLAAPALAWCPLWVEGA